MIKRVYDKQELFLSQDYYSSKIRSYIDAYGMRYGFCRFYSVSDGLATGSIMLLNGAAVMGGNMIESDEISDFIKMESPSSIECPRGLASRMKFRDFSMNRRVLFRMESDPDFDEDTFSRGLDSPVSLQQMFTILNSCFDGLQYDLWYTDMSHRMRHEISRPFTYRSCTCASIDLIDSGKAYISGVATMPAERKKGNASGLLKYIAALLERNGIQGYLWAMESKSPYYRKMGFSPADEDLILLRQTGRGQ